MNHFTEEVDEKTKNAFYHAKSNSFRKWRETPVISNNNLDKGKLRASSKKILRLVDLDISSFWATMTPTIELMTNSLLINPIPYVKRALFISKLRKDKYSLLLIKQKLKCPACGEDLIKWDELLNHNSTGIIEYLNSASNEVLEDNESGKKNRSSEKTVNLLDSRVKNWLKNVHIDHIVPKVLAGKIEELNKILDNNNNLQLLHVLCHKKKTNTDSELVGKYRQIRKSLLGGKKIKDLNSAQLDELTVKILKQLHSNNSLENLDKKTVHKMMAVVNKNLKGKEEL